MAESYYEDELVTLYLGDNTEHTDWTECDCMITDPPYGRKWRQGRHRARDGGYKASSAWSAGIIGDESTEARDRVLELWGPDKPAILFGDLMLAPPHAARLVCVYAKPNDAGALGAIGGVRRDCEAIYMCGKDWRAAIGGRSSIFRTAATSQAGVHGIVHRSGGHPHAKALDVMRDLIALTPPGASIADPFTGSGSTLLAAKLMGQRAVGVEIDERAAALAARRLSETLPGLTTGLAAAAAEQLGFDITTTE
jgi:gp76